MKKLFLLSRLLLLLFLFTSCQAAANRKNSSETREQPVVAGRQFPQVSIPTMIRDDAERVNYLLEHYWDKFDFSDRSWINHPQELKKGIFDYVRILPLAGSKETVIGSLRNTLNRSATSADMQAAFAETLEGIFADPNSPLRNEDLHLEVLSFILDSEFSEPAAKERAKFDRNLLMKNRVGDLAANFKYTLQDGRSEMLHNLPAECTLLMFYNPGCDACESVIAFLKQAKVINEMQQSGRLKVLALFPDKDLAEWQSYRDNIPAEWVNAYDHDQRIENELLYDLKAIPTLYLLDKQKRVLLKDPDVREVIHYLTGQ